MLTTNKLKEEVMNGILSKDAVYVVSPGQYI